MSKKGVGRDTGRNVHEGGFGFAVTALPSVQSRAFV